MKSFKNITKYFLAAILIVIALPSCKKFLDLDPQGKYDTGTYPYPKGSGPFDGDIFAAYDVLRSYDATGSGFIAATSIRSDDADKGSTPTDGPSSKEFDDFTLISTNGLLDGMWKSYYNLIGKANGVLDRIAKDQDPGTTTEVKTYAEAEAKFLRAYGYFMLVRLFGRVPLVDKVYADPTQQANIPQSEPTTIYTFIESDLNFAGAHLPPSWDPNIFPGRATSGSANGLLAKVYLTQKKWGPAMSAANKVIISGQYDLSTTYDKIFGEDGENSKESVFEIQCTATLVEKRANGSQFASIQGVRGSGDWNLGWGFNSPSGQLSAAYETNDPRKARTFLSVGVPTIYGETLLAGNQAADAPKVYNHKVHSNPARRKALLDNFSYWMNIRILRYADVVLMYAEAANEVGGTTNTTDALEKLNSVRLRARNGNNAILPNVTTTDQGELRNAIRQERRIELAMEYDRFFDLVRWGTAKTVLHAAGKTGFVEGKHEILPIPAAQIQISKGVLTQNFGYN
ncbi:RagB/SusD family nutrient uptake outer membrane protein [Pedobacter sp. UBA4863]|uniref:RagB/SusD family nutrient uptake outer membrane protein n=1 Tax=Pedobacter sp. UBA4863 TaxID=1947060 RepID=UPI0025DBFC2B|nr:RagB/SusD family nutrient uptake outer membrane protein [Pedobacter sp. UBA4863]